MADEKNENEIEETEAAPEAVADVEDAPAGEPQEAAVEEAAEGAVDAPAQPVAEAEAAEEPAEAAEPVAEAEAAGEEPAEEAAEAEPAEAAEAPAPEPKRKKKRLPRALRRTRSTTVREKPKERRPITRLPKPEHERGRSQQRQGKVVSAAMDKTIVVRVDTVKVHPRYKKVIRRSSKFHAHDEQNEAKVGDIVLIVETRPLSRTKRWRLQRIVEAAR
jgi:small subunit ribosomal protein S17